MEKNEERFTQLYIKNYQKVFGYVYKRVENAQIAEDLTMDVFVKCYERFEDFNEERASFATWLFVIVNNKLKNYYRDKKRFDDLDEDAVVYESFEDDIIQAQYLADMRRVLADALESLNEMNKRIIVMKYFESKNSNEIALELGLTPSNVRVMLSRSMTALRNYFKKNNIDVEL